MKTGQLLFLSGMNRDTFNTLARRGHLQFLEKHTGPGGEGGDGVDRFGPWHALGLAAFVRLRQMGLEPAIAGSAVHDSWPDIVRIAGLINEPPRSSLCGIRINDLGLVDTWGWPHPKGDGGEPIGSVRVDLPQLWAILSDQLAEREAA